MKKLLALFMVSIPFSPVIAHSDEHTSIEPNESSSVENQEKKSSISSLKEFIREGVL